MQKIQQENYPQVATRGPISRCFTAEIPLRTQGVFGELTNFLAPNFSEDLAAHLQLISSGDEAHFKAHFNIYMDVHVPKVIFCFPTVGNPRHLDVYINEINEGYPNSRMVYNPYANHGAGIFTSTKTPKITQLCRKIYHTQSIWVRENTIFNA